MTAQLIDGKKIAAQIREEVKTAVSALQTNHNLQPALATILVGDDQASASYVRSKHKACAKVGIHSHNHQLPHNTTQTDLEALISQLNQDETIHGILLQLPLPDHLDETAVLNLITPHKDVDGLHPFNIGRLTLKGQAPNFYPCTPKGCLRLLQETGVSLAGKHAVIIGRSNLVGTPLTLMLQAQNATITQCHSYTADLIPHLKTADIVIAAAGQPNLITADMLKEGVVVIDVGINYVDDPSRKRGYRLVGDVHFDSVKEIAAAITPVPGGVGPMTIAMLLQNTVEAAHQSAKSS